MADADKIFKELLENGSKGGVRSLVSLSLVTFYEDENKSRSSGQDASDNVMVKIQSRGDYIVADIIFENTFNEHIKKIWSLMESYGGRVNFFDTSDDEMDNKENENENENKDIENTEDDDIRIGNALPLASLTIIPEEYKGEYFFLGTNPIFWALQPSIVGGQNNVIRILFEEDEFGFYEGTDLNVEEMYEEVMAEEKERVLIEERQNSIEEERQDYNNYRNELLEELRREKKNS